MGQQNSKQKQIQVSINHPKFETAKIVKLNDQQFLQTLIGAEEKQYLKWTAKLADLKSQNQHLLIPVRHQFSAKGLCGSTGTITADFENYPYLLTQQIYNRSGQKTKFQQTDIWYLLFSLAAAQHQMQKLGLPVGDIRPRNVFLSEIGKVKVTNLLSWPMELRAYDKAMQYEDVYLSPEQVQKLQRNQVTTVSSSANQIFSIGLTLFNAATLQNEGGLYDWKNKYFIRLQLERRVNEWIVSHGYSQILKATILNLIQISPQKRLTQQQLWDFISKHQKPIQNRQNFVIDNAPGKIHQAFHQLKQKKELISKRLDSSVVVKHEIADIPVLRQIQQRAKNLQTNIVDRASNASGKDNFVIQNKRQE